MSNNRYAWLAQDEFSASDVLGGARGTAEAVVPGLVFLGFYVLSVAIIRLIQRQSIVQSLSGLLGVGIALVWALVSGKGINFFTWGIVTNAAWALVLLVSLVIGWPLVSVLFGLLTGRPIRWVKESEARDLAVKCVWLTLAWSAVFIIRLAVQVPLWLSEQVAWLSAMKIALGIPLFIPVAWLTWWLLKDDFRLHHARSESAQDPEED